MTASQNNAKYQMSDNYIKIVKENRHNSYYLPLLSFFTIKLTS
jgi:hypothetical protein